MTDHVFLVAVSVKGDAGRDAAQHALIDLMPQRGAAAYGGSAEGIDTHGRIDSWWIAEDDRRDGSDCDSAVFIRKGQQRPAHEVLVDSGLTYRHSKPVSA